MTIEERVAALERNYQRMKLAQATLLKLEAGDVIVVTVQRPLATSENQAITDGFKRLLTSLGHADDIQVVVMSDLAEIKTEVLRVA